MENIVASKIGFIPVNNLLTSVSPDTGRVKELNYQTFILFAVTSFVFITTLPGISAG
jgi:hypothetical protein